MENRKDRRAAVAGVFLVYIIAACSGGSAGSPASSRVAPAAVAPSITAQPKNTSVTVGQAASFTVAATGTAPLAYQWRLGGSEIAGATALIVVFDESANDNTDGGGRIAAVFISPKFSKVGYQSTTFYQHESTLRLTLGGLGITTALPGAAATAPTMWEFFSFTPP
jgi:hypothetical protein